MKNIHYTLVYSKVILLLTGKHFLSAPREITCVVINCVNCICKVNLISNEMVQKLHIIVSIDTWHDN